MNEERTATRGPALGRWMIVAAIVVAGLVLYFRFAPTSDPPVPVGAAAGR